MTSPQEAASENEKSSGLIPAFRFPSFEVGIAARAREDVSIVQQP
jgi:hypothetical protein